MEYLDIYDRQRNKTGRTHLRGLPVAPGDFLLATAVWVTDGTGKLLVTLRSPEKNYCPNYWENPGGAVRAGENSRDAISRELWEETGIRALPRDFELLESIPLRESFVDVYYLQIAPRPAHLRLQEGETVDYRWLTPQEISGLLDAGLMAPPIAENYLHLLPKLQTHLSAATK